MLYVFFNCIQRFVYDFGRELNRILIDKDKIMSNQKDSEAAETKPELYTLLCPVDLFRYFLRKLYKDIEISNEDIDEIGEGFYEYLRGLNLTEKQRQNILPKDTFDVILNANHPFRTEGFPTAYVLHFTEYVEKQKEALDNGA